MTEIISFDEKKEKIIEDMITQFLCDYPWFERRLNNMSTEHRDAVGILIENHPQILYHLKEIFDVNLDEDGFDYKEMNVWYVTREQQTLLGVLALPYDDDTLNITNYVKGSGIIGLDGVEIDSTAKGQ